MISRRLAALTAILLCVTACGDDDDASGASTAASSSVVGTSSSSPPGENDTTENETFGTVSSDITGTAVAGNNGDVDAEVRFSESIRLSDGACRGWDDPNSLVRTAGLENGAPVEILDENDGVVGVGSVVSSRWFDAGDGNENWTCEFEYQATIDGPAPQELRVRIADLPPWRAVRDDAGIYVASVDSAADPESVPDCSQSDGLRRPTSSATTDPDDTAEPMESTASTEPTGSMEPTESTSDDTAAEPAEWESAVASYWSDAMRDLCENGFVIAGVERGCRPPRIGSDYVFQVVRGDDPSVVLEDVSGPQAAADDLTVGTGVTVFVATGRPC